MLEMIEKQAGKAKHKKTSNFNEQVEKNHNPESFAKFKLLQFSQQFGKPSRPTSKNSQSGHIRSFSTQFLTPKLGRTQNDGFLRQLNQTSKKKSKKYVFQSVVQKSTYSMEMRKTKSKNYQKNAQVNKDKNQITSQPKVLARYIDIKPLKIQSPQKLQQLFTNQPSKKVLEYLKRKKLFKQNNLENIKESSLPTYQQSKKKKTVGLRHFYLNSTGRSVVLRKGQHEHNINFLTQRISPISSKINQNKQSKQLLKSK